MPPLPHKNPNEPPDPNETLYSGHARENLEGAGSTSSAEVLYVEYLQQAAAAGGLSFDEWVNGRTELASELRAIHRDMAVADSALGCIESRLELGYEFLESLGAGGDGEVYRARDKALHREVAIKLLKLRNESSAGRRQRFLQEARTMAMIRHENVVRIHAIEELEGEIQLVMELVEGRTLQVMVAESGPLSAPEAARIGIDLCRALSALHKADLVHLDVKPGNIMREKGGRIVLLDFGLVRSPSPSEQKLGGTPPFMAPEHFGQGVPGQHTDVYGLGATLYWLLCGQYPMLGSNLQAIREDVTEGRTRPLLDLNPTVPAGFVDLIERAMSLRVEDRFVSMGFFERELRCFLSGAYPETAKPAPRFSRRTAIAMSLVGAVALLGFGLYWSRISSAMQTLVVVAEFTHYPVVGEPQPLEPSSRVQIEDLLSLQVQGSEPFYLYLFNEDEEGRCFTLYPKEGAHQRLPAGESLRLPNSKSTSHWTVTSAGGTEHFFLIASRVEEPLGEWLRIRVPRPQMAGGDFRVSTLSRGAATELAALSRGVGLEILGEAPSNAGALEGSLAQRFETFSKAIEGDEGRLVIQWDIPHAD